MHPLDGPRGKVERANRQIITLQQDIQGFFGEHLYEIRVAEYNPKPDNYSLRVKSGPQEFPISWSVLIGEIAHNLRSALDGLTWQLALLGPEDPWFRTSFPICLDKDTWRKIGDRNYPSFCSCTAKPRGSLQSVPDRFWARIESFQPYQRGNGRLRSPLVLLNELNNTDKHRLVAVLACTPAQWQFSGLVGGLHFKRGVTLRPNAKIGWVRDVPPNKPGQGGIYTLDFATMQLLEPKMEVNVTVAPGIRFGDTCKTVSRLPMMSTLRSMAYQVSSIVESFGGES